MDNRTYTFKKLQIAAAIDVNLIQLKGALGAASDAVLVTYDQYSSVLSVKYLISQTLKSIIAVFIIQQT